MSLPDRLTYLAPVTAELAKPWPANRIVNIVCHGHSVPAGYFTTPVVEPFDSYPHLLHLALHARYPFAPLNVIVTAKGGEDSASGSGRFQNEVLCHRPDVVTIDYGLNDRKLSPPRVRTHWSDMVEQALEVGSRVVLLTPSWDTSVREGGELWERLGELANEITGLAGDLEVGLTDSFGLFQDYVTRSGELTDLLSFENHPNARGHQLIARDLARWFVA